MIFHPETLWYLFVLIPVISIMIIRFLKGRQDLRKISGVWRDQLYYDLYTLKSFFISFAMIIFIIFAIFSLAGFSGKEITKKYDYKGVDIIFVMDISNSMKAEDVKPSRLKKAISLVRSICENTTNTRYGLITFKGQGIKNVPITEDRQSIYLFLSFLESNNISTPGTNIQSGIKIAQESFPKGEDRKKYLILLSDGEALSGETYEASEIVKQEEVTVISIGIGTKQGSNIPNSSNGVLVDNSGKKVVTRLNEQSLRLVSELTGGSYFIYSEPHLLPELIKIISIDMDDQNGFKTVNREKYRVFLIISLTALFVSILIKRLKWKNYF